MYDAINSIYTYKDSDTLKNKLNIKDEIKLKKYETEMVAFKLSTLRDKNIRRTYDEKHLKAIHKHLFCDVYDFAGEYRRENITKENFRFSEYYYIEENIGKILSKINVKDLKKLSFDELIVFISQIMTDLNVLHPFREGNGRATREFIRELLDDLGYEINWFLIDYNEILKASIKAVIDEEDQILLLKKSIKVKEDRDIEFIYEIFTYLNLGKIIKKPERLTGGLMHKMYKAVTNDRKYVVKLLNPNVMKRKDAIKNFENAEKLEEILYNNNIPAIYPLKFNDKKMQKLNGKYFYIFDFYEGCSIKNDKIKEINCSKIAKTLADIHNIDIKYEKYTRDEINIDWNYYINKSKNKVKEIYELLSKNIDLLNSSMKNGNIAIKNVPSIMSICHNDLDSKNVLWKNNDFKIIDLECLGYYNPYLELFELALCWSGYENLNADFELFKTFIKTYLKNIKFKFDIDIKTLYNSNYSRLEWLEYNIKRALGMESSNADEQELGMNEVRNTINHVIYYDKIKDDIITNLESIIK